MGEKNRSRFVEQPRVHAQTSPATPPGAFCLQELLWSCCKWPKGFVGAAGLAVLVLAAPHKRIGSPPCRAPRHEPSKRKGQRDSGTCSSPESVYGFRWSRSSKSAFKDHFCCIYGKEKLWDRNWKRRISPRQHWSLHDALDLLRRAATWTQPLLDPPARTSERHYTRCRPPRLYPKSFAAKTHTMKPGL